MPLYPQSVANQGACPNSLLFRCLHFRFTFESIKGAWERVIYGFYVLCRFLLFEMSELEWILLDTG
jgi:hypothetical protein